MKKVNVPNETKENDYERFFRWYCEDLIEAGFIKRLDREPETLLVLPEFNHYREKHFVRKENEKEEFTLLQSVTYTYDFRIIWEKKAFDIFTEIYSYDTHFVYNVPTFISHLKTIGGDKEVVSYVDVKPHSAAARFGGGKNASYYTFPIIQKYLMMAYSLYINKVIPIPSGKHGRTTCLFAETFTPKRYRYTDKSLKKRTMHHKPIRSLSSFVKYKSKIIENLKAQKANKKSNQKKMF